METVHRNSHGCHSMRMQFELAMDINNWTHRTIVDIQKYQNSC